MKERLSGEARRAQRLRLARGKTRLNRCPGPPKLRHDLSNGLDEVNEELEHVQMGVAMAVTKDVDLIERELKRDVSRA